MSEWLARLWLWGRIVVLLLLAAQAAWYARDAAEEAKAIRTHLLTRIPAGATPREKIEQSMHVAFDLPPHRGVHLDYGLMNPLMKLLRPSALRVYEHGGHCSKRSRLLSVLLRQQGIPAHKLFLYNERGLELLHDPPRAWVHVVVEAQLDGRWVVADPLFNLVFVRPDSTLAGAEDLRAHPEVLRAGRERADERYDVWEDSLYTYQDVRRFPWFKIPLVGEMKYDAVASILGKPSADEFVTPYVLEEPQTAIVVFSLVGMGLIGLTFVPRRRRRRR